MRNIGFVAFILLFLQASVKGNVLSLPAIGELFDTSNIHIADDANATSSTSEPTLEPTFQPSEAPSTMTEAPTMEYGKSRYFPINIIKLYDAFLF